MNKHTSIKPAGSLLERASELYGFSSALRTGGLPIALPPVAEPSFVTQTIPVAEAILNSQSFPVAADEPAIVAEPVIQPTISQPSHAVSRPMAPAQHSGRFAKIDRDMLRAGSFIDPEGPVSGLSEEFRIVKRQLLLSARGGKGHDVIEHGERILVCSAHPNEGKTYCSINLALSMASEKDNRVLLIDADFAKPSILSTLGIPHSPGLMDALADRDCDAESYIIQTDIDGLSVLPAGAQTNQDTEYLAASRTAEIIDQLTRNDPSRIIIFDSPPALAASPASVLALHVGQCLMVVNADVTTDSALRDALSLLSGCDHVQLLLNRAKFSPTGRKFGNYYGYGA